MHLREEKPASQLPDAGFSQHDGIVCSNLRFTYPRKGSFALGSLNVRFDVGLNFLVGENGAGKSTLMGLLAGELRPTSGTIERNGSNLVGFLPQDMGFPRFSTLKHYLGHVAWLQGVARRDRLAAVDATLVEVGLFERRDSKISSLSGGMLRRLGIAQTLVGGCSVILLDEPTVGLDPLQRRELRRLLSNLANDRILIVSTHLIEDVQALGGNLVVLNGGNVTFSGPAESVGSFKQSFEEDVISLMGGEERRLR